MNVEARFGRAAVHHRFGKGISRNLGEIFKPIVPVTVIGPRGSMKLLTILDSGADISLFPYSVGERIGLPLDVRNRREVHGIGEGSVAYILSTVKLRVSVITIIDTTVITIIDVVGGRSRKRRDWLEKKRLRIAASRGEEVRRDAVADKCFPFPFPCVCQRVGERETGNRASRG